MHGYTVMYMLVCIFPAAAGRAPHPGHDGTAGAGCARPADRNAIQSHGAAVV